MSGVPVDEILEAENGIDGLAVLAASHVVISTEGSKTPIEELKEAGIRDYLRKPFTPESLKNVLREITGE